MITFEKITTGQRDDYTNACLLYCNYFNNYYKMIAIGLSKELDSDYEKCLIMLDTDS